MRALKMMMGGLVVVLTVVLAVWLGHMPAGQADARKVNPTKTARALRLGVVPERDIYQQRRRFRALTDYLAEKLGRPIELVTAAAYEDVIGDLKQDKTDGAFVGSMLAVLAVDRLDARVLVKSELPGNVPGYHGVMFVRDDSPVHAVKDLAGRSIAMLRTTQAGHLFPMWQMQRAGILKGAGGVKIVWMGTHDDVVRAVMEKRVDAGAAKDLRLAELERSKEASGLRRIAASALVPENALVVRPEIAHEIGPALADALLAMENDPRGAEALNAFGIARFVPCSMADYQSIYDMIDEINWKEMEIDGPAPRRR